MSGMRTIGILGGIGPQATIDFEARLHTAAQAILPQHVNEGYPPMVTVYLRHAPVLVNERGMPSAPLTLDPRVLDAAERLGQWADLLICPSNTPHFFVDEIEAASGCEMLSIVDVAVAELRRRAVQRVGLTGLGVPKVYSQRLAAEGFEVVVAGDAEIEGLDGAILRLTEGRTTAAHRAAAQAAVDAVRAQGVEATILGCTEIPLLLGDSVDAKDLVNPAQLLAEAAIRRATESPE